MAILTKIQPARNVRAGGTPCFTTATAFGAGLEDVGGNGFGCAILLRSVLQEVAIRHDGPPSSWYYVNFYRDVAASGRCRARADFRIVCEHLEAR